MTKGPPVERTNIERMKSVTLDMWHVCGGYKPLKEKRKGF